MRKKNLFILFFVLILNGLLISCASSSDNESDSAKTQALNEQLEILQHFKIYTTEGAQQ